jgi:hypothetical protein
MIVKLADLLTFHADAVMLADFFDEGFFVVILNCADFAPAPTVTLEGTVA